MKLIAVKELPKSTQTRARAGIEALDEFVKDGYSKAKIIFYPDECSTSFGMYASISQYARKNKLPVKVVLRGNDVYLVKKYGA